MKRELTTSMAHIFALFTIIIWGTTFIASKLLLDYYSPVQIMLMRFAIAYGVLWILRPKVLKLSIKEEMRFLVLGILGCTLYFLTENYALTYTMASNVSILVAAAPIFTAILAHFFLEDEQLKPSIFLGFLIAIIGVALVVFNGTVILKLNPLGDMLSIGAALCWASYSVLLKKQVHSYDCLLLTRRVMLWGFVTALPIGLLEGRPFLIAPMLNEGTLLFCVLYLGILGSGICYVLWNKAIQKLGTVVTNNYIYVNPFSTMVAATFVLKEQLSFMGIGGAALILIGVFIADKKVPLKLEKSRLLE